MEMHAMSDTREFEGGRPVGNNRHRQPDEKAAGKMTIAYWWARRHTTIAIFTLFSLGVYLLLRFVPNVPTTVTQWPLWITLAIGGVPLVGELAVKLLKGL